MNGFYRNHFTVFADVVDISLQLSTDELNIESSPGLPPDSSECPGNCNTICRFKVILVFLATSCSKSDCLDVPQHSYFFHREWFCNSGDESDASIMYLLGNFPIRVFFSVVKIYSNDDFYAHNAMHSFCGRHIAMVTN